MVSVHHWVKTAMEVVKEKVIKEIKASSGLFLDTVTDSWGNTNAGPVADRFFGPKDRDNICSATKKTDQHEDYKMYVFIAVSQQVGQMVNPSEGAHQQCYVLCKEAFPFVMLVP